MYIFQLQDRDLELMDWAASVNTFLNIIMSRRVIAVLSVIAVLDILFFG